MSPSSTKKPRSTTKRPARRRAPARTKLVAAPTDDTLANLQ